MILPTFLLLQMAISLPPLGYIESPDRRHFPIYGMQGNFLRGDALPDDVLAIARFDSIEIRKRGALLLLSGSADSQLDVGPGPAFFAFHSDSGRIYTWLPANNEWIVWTGTEWQRIPAALPESVFSIAVHADRLIALSRTTTGILRSEFDARSLQFLRQTELSATTQAVIDSRGNLWQATGSQLTCGSTQRSLPDPVVSLTTLADGWVVITTTSNLPTYTRTITRCQGDQAQLPALP